MQKLFCCFTSHKVNDVNIVRTNAKDELQNALYELQTNATYTNKKLHSLEEKHRILFKNQQNINMKVCELMNYTDRHIQYTNSVGQHTMDHMNQCVKKIASLHNIIKQQHTIIDDMDIIHSNPPSIVYNHPIQP